MHINYNNYKQISFIITTIKVLITYNIKVHISSFQPLEVSLKFRNIKSKKNKIKR